MSAHESSFCRSHLVWVFFKRSENVGVELYNWNLSPCPSPWQLQSNVSGLSLTTHIYVPSECSQSGRTAPRMVEAMTGFQIALEKKRESEGWREEKKHEEWMNLKFLRIVLQWQPTYIYQCYMLDIKIEEAILFQIFGFLIHAEVWGQ